MESGGGSQLLLRKIMKRPTTLLWLMLGGVLCAAPGDLNLGTVQQASGPPKVITVPAPAAGQIFQLTGNPLAPVQAVASGSIITSTQQLISWVSGENYEALTINRDSDSAITTATIKWPDGVTGTFATTLKNPSFLVPDSYTITYSGSPTRTITQAAVTRDVNGAVTVKPALTVAP